MKKQAMLFVVLMLTGALLAAENADFSGTWTLNADKSEAGERGGRAFSARTMTITQSDDQITIKRVYAGRDDQEITNEETISLKGKESKNENRFGVKTSVAKWEKNGEQLVIDSKMTAEREGQSFEITTLEKWSLGKDGKELIIEMTMSTPRGERQRKLVYSKS